MSATRMLKKLFREFTQFGQRLGLAFKSSTTFGTSRRELRRFLGQGAAQMCGKKGLFLPAASIGFENHAPKPTNVSRAKAHNALSIFSDRDVEVAPGRSEFFARARVLILSRRPMARAGPRMKTSVWRTLRMAKSATRTRANSGSIFLLGHVRLKSSLNRNNAAMRSWPHYRCTTKARRF